MDLVPTDETFDDKGTYSPNSPSAQRGPQLLRSQQYDTALRENKRVAKPVFPKKKRYQSFCNRTKILIASAVLVVVLLLIVVLPLALTLGGSKKTTPTSSNQQLTGDIAPAIFASLKIRVDPLANSSNSSLTLEDHLQSELPVAHLQSELPDASSRRIKRLSIVDDKLTESGEPPLKPNGNDVGVAITLPEKKIDNVDKILDNKNDSSTNANATSEQPPITIAGLVQQRIFNLLSDCFESLSICGVFNCTHLKFDNISIEGNGIEAEFKFNLIPVGNESPIINISLPEVMADELKLKADILQQFSVAFPQFEATEVNITFDLEMLCEDEKLKHVNCINETTTAQPPTTVTNATIATIRTTRTTRGTTKKHTLSPPKTCKGIGFMCKTSGAEISVHQMCDGRMDCEDGSDEDSCSVCKTNFFCPLKNSWRKCLRGKVLCDHVKDCEDGLDEILYCKTKCLVPSDYKCTGADICIPKSFVCDGDPQCPNEDDELGCYETKCTNGAKWCDGDKRCIASWQWCDGTQHCSDGSDELQCDCTSCNGKHAVLCPGSDQCINKAQLCDGHTDCLGNTDEIGCPGYCELQEEIESLVCQDNKRYSTHVACSGLIKACQLTCAGRCDTGVAFMCKSSNICIPKRKMCDREPDCTDGSDEAASLCSCSNPGIHRCKSTTIDKCIPDHVLCDGYADCEGGEDERDCTDCRGNVEAFFCRTTNMCYPKTARCNGIVDCPDHSDEDFCSCAQCKSQVYETFLCKGHSRCLKKSLMCGKSARYTCPGTHKLDKIDCA